MVKNDTQKTLTEILEENSDNTIVNEVDEWKNKYLYLQVDLENIKKRYNKQIVELQKYEGENIFKEIIDFVDFLQLQIDNHSKDSRLKELKLRMLKLLKMFDVQPIYEERPAYFNDEYDEAVLSKDCNDPTLNNSIESVYKQGWRFKDKILRYEQVVVNKYKENND